MELQLYQIGKLPDLNWDAAIEVVGVEVQGPEVGQPDDGIADGSRKVI